MQDNHSPLKIGLMGPFGGGNLGDAAIQEAMIQHIRRYFPQAQIYGFSLIPEDTEARHGIPSYPIQRISPNWRKNGQVGSRRGLIDRIAAKLKASPNPRIRNLERWVARAPQELSLILRAYQFLRGFNLFIISGGGQLDDYWGGAWSHPYTMLKFTLLAKLRGAKVYFVSVGAGPIDAFLSRLFIRCALSLASYRSYRDESSKRVIERIGFVRDDPVYPDLALSLDKAAYSENDQSKPRLLVGINPMVYFEPTIWPERDHRIYAAYLRKLAEVTCWLLERQYSILLFPGESYHDQKAIRDLMEILRENTQTYSEGRVLAPPILTVNELMSQLAQTDLIIASRLHSVILAQLIHKPVLALSYHPKINVLMENTGQAEYCLPIDQFSVDALKERFIAMEKNCAQIKAQLAQKTQEYRDALEAQYECIFGNGVK